MTAQPQRIQQRRTRGWRMPLNAKSVARPSKWGNPFSVVASDLLPGMWEIVNAKSHQVYAMRSSKLDATVYAVGQFRDRLAVAEARGGPAWRTYYLGDLVGHDLACWCNIGDPCHADVLLELANR